MGKPVCSKCGGQHWRFVRCEDAPAAQARDNELAELRERRKVTPIWRTDNNRVFRGNVAATWHTNEFVNPRPPEAA